ncbi:MAG: hypothetical protein Q9174_001228 [Haloplaca sp. 1 TL-2023]
MDEMANKDRGYLCVVEGLDRAGKSTQCEKLVQWFQQQGTPVKHMKFPDRSTAIGKLIDSYLKGELEQEDHVIHLLFAANRWEFAARIREDIANGITIVIDRYYYSGMIYSAAKNNPSLSLDRSMRADFGLPRPDLCICFMISSQTAVQRGGFGLERYETIEMQNRVLNLFKYVLESSQYPECSPVVADKSVEEVYANMIELVSQKLKDVDVKKPLKTYEHKFDVEASKTEGVHMATPSGS